MLGAATKRKSFSLIIKFQFILYFRKSTLIRNNPNLFSGDSYSSSDYESDSYSKGDAPDNIVTKCPQTLEVKNVIIHPDFEDNIITYNDVALVQLFPTNQKGQCAVFTEDVQPACLPQGLYNELIISRW